MNDTYHRRLGYEQVLKLGAEPTKSNGRTRTVFRFNMLDRPKRAAPEPYHSAALYLLYHVALYIRNRADAICKDQLSDLGEAIHDVPESLTEYGHYFDEKMIRDLYLAAYDQKWAKSPGDFSLLRTLDEGVERVKQWRTVDPS
jgi:hypothetical protein